MKNLSFFVSALALYASTSYAAIDCKTLPTCASLGYNDVATQCPKSSTGAELVVRCPFDTTQGKCIREAAVGQIAYFSKAPNAASGWLLCNGQTITKATYPELYAFLDNQFCTADHGGTCGTDVGRVPDYRGYFLRVYAGGISSSSVSSSFSSNGGSVNSSFTSPQKEQLPNITGYFAAVNQSYNSGDDRGAITLGDTWSTKISGGGKNDDWGRWYEFYASNTDGSGHGVYKDGAHVIPANYAVYAYIYAGRVVK